MIDISLDALFIPFRGSPAQGGGAKRPSPPTPSRRRAETILPAVQPNIGLELAYRKRLIKLIDDMHRSTTHWLTRAFNRTPPEMALDDLSYAAMRDAVAALVKQWVGKFDEMRDQLGAYFASSIARRTDDQLKSILRDAGFTIDWTMTAAQRDVLGAIIAENVALIRSIPEQYFGRVAGDVMRSVQAGYDTGQLTKDLQANYGVTKKRAAFIARDQTRKATAMLSRARMVETGIQEAIWVHSGGGKTPRPAHVAAGNRHQRFDVKKGWFDPHERQWILPGFLPNCRCVMRPVIKGVTKP